jgi:hypothetical protein
MLLTYALSMTTPAKDRKRLAAILDALLSGLQQLKIQDHYSVAHSAQLQNAASEFFSYIEVNRKAKNQRIIEISSELEDLLTKRFPAPIRDERLAGLMVKVRAEARRLA